jgi:death-on-curing protein
LDLNELTLDDDVTQDALYDLMLKIAAHGFAARTGHGDQSDDEVEQIARWFRKRIRRVEKVDRVITCRELRTILRGYGYELEDHEGNHVSIVRYREERRLFGLRPKRIRERIMRIPYARDGAPVGKSVLKELRERCSLTERDGVDSVMFYSNRRPTDYFVTRYRKTLSRLAKV